MSPDIDREGSASGPPARGPDFSRVTAFSDGVFAIAITLLILQIEIPTHASSSSELFEALSDESGDFFAFGLSFVVIGTFWIGHNRFMRNLSTFDSGLVGWNLLYLAFMVMIPFFSQLIGEFGEISLAVFLYAINLALLTTAQILMVTHAINSGLVEPGYAEGARVDRKSLVFTALVFALTAPLAFLLGSWITVSWLALAANPFERGKYRSTA